MQDFPDIDCLPPPVGSPGDVWYCPGCARKFYYVLITIEDNNAQVEAWYTDEVR